MKTKIFLADLVHNFAIDQANGDVSDHNFAFAVPYGIGSIAAHTRKVLGESVDISLFKFPNDLLELCDKEVPDVIGFSNYIWNTHLNFTIGSYLRSKFPGTLIIFGGPSIRTDRHGIEGFLRQNKYIDMYIIEEGEWPFVEVIQKFNTMGRDILNADIHIGGAAYLSNQGFVFNKRDEMGNLDDIPSPYVSGLLDEFLRDGLTPLFETNRGCPFQCTFCAWGFPGFNKVRKFSLNRVFSDLEYVSSKYSKCRAWWFVDANFGILKRDLEIAKKINSIMKKNKHLRTTLVYDAKNTTDRTIKISKLIRSSGEHDGHFLDHGLIALQTLDQQAQIAVKRSNIHLDDIQDKVDAMRSECVGVRTDIISGLPGETYQGHIDTLRRCFEYGFDLIGIYNAVVLPGTEMETQASRNKYEILSKFCPSSGGGGDYKGLLSIEAQEVVIANSAISENELLTLRVMHWLIWYGWNHQFLKPIFLYAIDRKNLNPIDIVQNLVVGGAETSKEVIALFDNVRVSLENQFFDDEESLRNHYLGEGEFGKAIYDRMFTPGFYYNSSMIQDKQLFKAMLQDLRSIVLNGDDCAQYNEIEKMMMRMRIEPDKIYYSNLAPETSFPCSKEIIRYFNIRKKEKESGVFLGWHLKKDTNKQKDIRAMLKKFSFEENKDIAVIKTLSIIPDAFQYNFILDRS